MKRYLPLGLIIGVLFIALGGLTLLFNSSRQSNAPATLNASSTINSLPALPPDTLPPHVRGGTNAKVALEEFGDYQCPPCWRLHPILQKIFSDYGNRISFTFRNFPIAQHKFAVLAAHTAEAAGQQGKFWEMHDLLYEKQPEWREADDARPLFMKYAQSLGLDTQRFAQDMDGSQASMRLILDQRRAQALNVKGTPTLFINGQEVPFEETMDYDKLHALIEQVLKNTQ